MAASAAPYAGKSDGAKSYDKKPYSGSGKPDAAQARSAIVAPRFNRDDRRDSSASADRAVRPREDRDGGSALTRRAAIADSNATIALRAATTATLVRPRGSPTKFGDKRPYTPRGEGFRKDGDRPRGDRPYSARPPRDGDRPERKFGGDKKFSRW